VHLLPLYGQPLPETHLCLLVDRIDVPTKLACIEVLRVEYDKLTDRRLGEKSEDIWTWVERAWEVQRHRFADTSLSCTIADLAGSQRIETSHPWPKRFSIGRGGRCSGTSRSTQYTRRSHLHDSRRWLLRYDVWYIG
jgi:hypothetical protein